ncbi:hypothetical protein J6590_002706 [Homalodisca vitripennis]|nr:hypothetical protein J6590_002706 [Homalodisca vitripennis]
MYEIRPEISTEAQGGITISAIIRGGADNKGTLLHSLTTHPVTTGSESTLGNKSPGSGGGVRQHRSTASGRVGNIRVQGRGSLCKDRSYFCPKPLAGTIWSTSKIKFLHLQETFNEEEY